MSVTVTPSKPAPRCFRANLLLSRGWFWTAWFLSLRTLLPRLRTDRRCGCLRHLQIRNASAAPPAWSHRRRPEFQPPSGRARQFRVVPSEHVETFPDAGPQQEGTAPAGRIWAGAGCAFGARPAERVQRRSAAAQCLDLLRRPWVSGPPGGLRPAPLHARPPTTVVGT
jgi:hypothetical protein